MIIESDPRTDKEMFSMSELNETGVVDVLTSGTNDILAIDGPLDNAA